MRIQVEFHARLAAILSSHPAFGQEAGRRALLLTSGLDEILVAQIELGGAPFSYLARLIDELAEYGELRDGRDALEAFLTTCRGLFGIEGVRELDEVIASWRTSRSSAASRPERIGAYLEHLVRRWRTLASPLLPDQVTLADIAMTLQVKVIRDEEGHRPAGPRPNPDFQLLDLLGKARDVERWLLLGDPGTGKTTSIIQTAAQLAENALADASASVPALASFVDLAQRSAGRQNYSLVEYYDEVGADSQLPGLGGDLRRLARHGRVVLLVDGADEVTEKRRAALLDLIQNGMFPGAGNRIIITSRKVKASVFVGYDRLDLASPEIDGQRHLLLSLCGEDKTKRLLAEISARPAVRDMARVPMMLTVLALVAREADMLSGDQVDYFRRNTDLFRLAVRILLEGRHRMAEAVADPYRAELVLAGASLRLHYRVAAAEGGETFRYDELEAAFQAAGPSLLSPWRGSRECVDDIAGKSGIVHPIDPLRSRYRYLHRTIREYLAALQVSAASPEQRAEFVRQTMGQQAWAEVLVLLGGMVPDVETYLSTLLQRAPDVALRTLKEVSRLQPDLAAQVLQLRPARLSDRREVFIELVRKLPRSDQVVDVLRAYLESVREAVPRVDLYFIREVLHCLDTRLSRELAGQLFCHLPVLPPEFFPPGYWCDVPAGPCVIGAAADDPNRTEWVPVATTIEIPAFKIGQVPVTNALYELFDPHHRDVRPFQDEIDPAELDLHPVVDVSWYEAQIFTEWAAQTFNGLRMPTEFEWEKAASCDGVHKRRLPWGDDWDPALLNAWEAGPNRTTPVGAYPGGASPCGALDMAGNVWEWCLNWYDESPDPSGFVHPAPQGVRRADRGGGWYHDVGRPCTFMRAADAPADRFAHCGFRLAQSPLKLTPGLDLLPDISPAFR